MNKNPYQSLNNIFNKLEKVLKLKKEEGLINNFFIEKILDDYSIEITVIYLSKLNKFKNIKTKIFLGKKNANSI